jgi:uncharacterized protein YecE (DUF72 family)
MTGRALIGTSGYVYGHWRRRFYPPDVPARDWLGYYARHFPTVELNNSFYRLPTADMFRAWRAAVPRGYVVAVKASRFLTHLKRLKDADRHLGLFLERARELGPALGPVLFQLPHHFHADVERLDGLLGALRRQRLVRGLRAALEVRHESWLIPDVFRRLERANVSLCIHDSKKQVVDGPLTADFVYVRRHGTGRVGNYSDRRLAADARRISGWLTEGRDVYVYFNNDWRGFAIDNARTLGSLLHVLPRPAAAQARRRKASRTVSSRYTRLIRPRAA